MALIGQIRKNSWILIVAIALGLGGFLLMDMVNANRGPGDGSSQLVVGRVNGEKIRRTDFEREYGLRFSGSSAPVYQNRNALWQWYTENTVLTGEADAIGLGVGATEITDLEFGDNPSPVIRRNFPNQQQPGAINREVLDYYKQHITNNTIQDEIDAGRMTPEILDFWPMQRRMIVKERLQAKLQAIVAKAMYTPTWMAEMGYKEQYETYDFVYAKVGYDLISNEEVSLGDSDLSDYLKKNAARFNRKQEQRVLDYVVFDVIPTAADSAEIRTKLAGLVEEFATTDSDSNFVLRNDGIITPAFSSKDELSTGIADTVMSMPVGSVYTAILKVVNTAYSRY
ncbi:MAG: SurA N-terminal domain-containing protein [Saprospiraceae bacterium]